LCLVVVSMSAAGCSATDGAADGDGADPLAGSQTSVGADGSDSVAGSVGDQDGGVDEPTDQGTAPGGDPSFDDDGPVAIEAGTGLRLLVDRSFSARDGVFDEFTLETGVEVEVVRAGTGDDVVEQLLDGDGPAADVVFGLDNLSLHRVAEAGVLAPYRSARSDDVAPDVSLGGTDLITPVAFDDLCVTATTDRTAAAPTTLEALADPIHASDLAVPDPASTVEGLAFLTAVIDAYGEDGWEDYWQRLVDGGATLVNDGEQPTGEQTANLVVASTMSPLIDALFAGTGGGPDDGDRSRSLSNDIVANGCFRRVEGAAVLAGTDHEAAARSLVDFFLSSSFQRDLPLNRFVQPASAEAEAELATELTALIAAVDQPRVVDPVEVGPEVDRLRDRAAEILRR
jgi:thiamine transport system substrate-binding protein